MIAVKENITLHRIEVVLKNTVKRADGILPPGIPGHDENMRGLDFDLKRAKGLIRESKYKDVSNLPKITFPFFYV